MAPSVLDVGQSEASVLDIYASMLACAQNQAEAIREDDWGAVSLLSEERAQLLTASETALAAGSVEDPEEAAGLLRALLSLDVTTTELLTVKREALREDMRNLRQSVVAVAGYRPAAPFAAGTLVDSLR